MGRNKYSPAARKKIIGTFIEITRKIIDDKGIDAVSIRKVASEAGYSSATMYIYFKDLDELITLSSIGYLQDYVSQLAQDSERMKNAEDLYFHVWDLFCRNSFAHAPIFKHLFFVEHSTPLDELIKEYYSIFPNELDNISGTVLSMLLMGDLHERTLIQLKPFGLELDYSEEELILINDITISYYRSLLEEMILHAPTPETIEHSVGRFLEGARFIILGDSSS